MEKIADALALILACTTANDASVNYRGYVPGCRSRYLEIPHCPDGKNADTLASILACKTAADALVNYRLCVPQRLKHFSHPPMGKYLVDMSNSILIFFDGCCLIYQFGVRAICA